MNRISFSFQFKTEWVQQSNSSHPRRFVHTEQHNSLHHWIKSREGEEKNKKNACVITTCSTHQNFTLDRPCLKHRKKFMIQHNTSSPMNLTPRTYVTRCLLAEHVWEKAAIIYKHAANVKWHKMAKRKKKNAKHPSDCNLEICTKHI